MTTFGGAYGQWLMAYGQWLKEKVDARELEE